jgi:uncharacterized damage-inducible protein DinB
MEQKVEGCLELYFLHKELIVDFLISLPSEYLSYAPIKGAGTFGKQFRHILDIDKCYIESIETGVLDFIRTDIDHTIENNKDELIRRLREEDRKLNGIIHSLNADQLRKKNINCLKVVKYLGEKKQFASIEQIISLMTEHKIFHEGELAIYFRSTGNKFPQSWIFWGLK